MPPLSSHSSQLIVELDRNFLKFFPLLTELIPNVTKPPTSHRQVVQVVDGREYTLIGTVYDLPLYWFGRFELLDGQTSCVHHFHLLKDAMVPVSSLGATQQQLDDSQLMAEIIEKCRAVATLAVKRHKRSHEEEDSEATSKKVKSMEDSPEQTEVPSPTHSIIKPTASPTKPTASPTKPTASPTKPTASPTKPTASPTTKSTTKTKAPSPIQRGTTLKIPRREPPMKIKLKSSTPASPSRTQNTRLDCPCDYGVCKEMAIKGSMYCRLHMSSQ